ncbi:DUF805 domain-containing protein [Brucella anthropi]|nr:DUF805 domain-containing protein [Brucella anthropi]
MHVFKHGISAISNHLGPLLSIKKLISRHHSQKKRWAVRSAHDEPAGVITGLVYLAHLVPSIAVGVRRLHDTDRSGWWLLAVFVPLIGQLAVLIFMCLPSSPGRNRFDSTPGYEPHEPFAGSKPATPASGNSLDQLEKIASLRASGAIDEDEFKQLKANVLTRPSR